MDFGLLDHPAFWTGLMGVAGTVGAFFTGRASSRKIDAEARKIERETDILAANELTTAEEKLHDRAINAMSKLADMYERNLASMQKTLDQMEAEVGELRLENAKLQSTVQALTQDNEHLRDLVSELQTHVQTLITALRQTKHDLPRLTELLDHYDTVGPVIGVNHPGDKA